MNQENTKKNPIDWFKNIYSNQNQSEEDNVRQSSIVTNPIKQDELLGEEESEQPNTENNNPFSRDNQDKVVLDSILALENIIKDRELILYRNKGLDEQLYIANETIARMKQEIVNKDGLLQDKNKEIDGLENSLTNKQMAYDQILEDYKEYQTNSNIEYEKISTQLETEINKYNKLNEESINAKHQNVLKVDELEEKNRNLEVENQRYIKQYKEIAHDKAELMKTINDFTQRMSFSFTPNKSNPNTSNSE